MSKDYPEFFLRLFLKPDTMLGPGKVELLKRIRNTGSISAAGREMGMSYKRAWGLVEDMNTMFREPLVLSIRGGPGGGGAELTEAGKEVVALYQSIVSASLRSNAKRLKQLREMLSDEVVKK